jgi:hypothetical protein
MKNPQRSAWRVMPALILIAVAAVLAFVAVDADPVPGAGTVSRP